MTRRELVERVRGGLRAELPDAALYFNDFSNHDATTDAAHVAHFEETTRFLLDHGAPVLRDLVRFDQTNIRSPARNAGADGRAGRADAAGRRNRLRAVWRVRRS